MAAKQIFYALNCGCEQPVLQQPQLLHSIVLNTLAAQSAHRRWAWTGRAVFCLFVFVLLLPVPGWAGSLNRVSTASSHVFAAATAQVSEADLCAPCNDGSQCNSSLCAIDSDGQGLCSQSCSATVGCPANFVCTAVSGSGSLCYPADASVCSNPYLAPLNTFCNVPATGSNPNLTISRTCAQGLTCYIFPSGYGACVEACSATDANSACAFGQTCCFGTDADGYCLGSTATAKNGGCFTIAQFGASCAQPDHSFCSKGSVCLYGQTAADARCYVGCSGGTCGAGGTCQSFAGEKVCCEVSRYNPNDTATCLPFAGACKRELGVVCSINAECLSGLCQRNNSQSACSIPCTSDAQCPGPLEDLNGDGIADGGATCLTLGTERRCWPKLGPAAAPACASVAKPTQVSEGCSCAMSAQPTSWMMLVLLAFARPWRLFRRFEL